MSARSTLLARRTGRQLYFLAKLPRDGLATATWVRWPHQALKLTPAHAGRLKHACIAQFNTRQCFVYSYCKRCRAAVPTDTLTLLQLGKRPARVCDVCASELQLTPMIEEDEEAS